MPKQDTPSILVLILAGSLAVSGPGTLLFAADPLSVTPPPLPETSLPEEEILQDIPDDPHAAFMQMSALSDPSPLSVTSLPQYPPVKASGYNMTGRTDLVGYVTLVPEDRSHFSYRYDLGGAAGATVDVSIGGESSTMDLSQGFSFGIKRENKLAGFPGVSTLHVVFIDSQARETVRNVTLSGDWANVNLDPSGAEFDASSVKKIIFRQSYEDVSFETLQEERRGTLFINLEGVSTPLPVAPENNPEPGNSNPVKPQNVSFEAHGSNLAGGTIPGFITPREDSEGYGFAYDVGGTRDSFVRAEIQKTAGNFSFHENTAWLSLKNSGNGAKVKVRFLDGQGGYAEFIISLTDSFQLFSFDLADAFFHRDGFDFQQVISVHIEVDRVLSPQRRGGIDFRFARGPQAIPFEDLKPSITHVSSEPDGRRGIHFSEIDGAAGYEAQVSTSSSFSPVLETVTSSSSPAIVMAEDPGTYYVRVRGIESEPLASGTRTQWSDAFSFIRNVPVDITPSLTLTTEDITVLPLGGAGAPGVTSIGGGNAVDVAVPTARGVQVTYNTGTNGFAGGGFTYDDFSTPSPAIESGDLSGLDEFVFGIKGAHANLKVEFVDASGNKAFVRLGGIASSEEKVWRIPAARLSAIDLAHVRIIYFIVEGINQSGTMEINRISSLLPLGPDAGLSAGDLTGAAMHGPAAILPRSVAAAGASSGVTEAERGFVFEYDTGSAGWSAGGWALENGSAGGDWSGLDELVFGLKGDAAAVKLEVHDKAGRKVAVNLTGISSTQEKIFALPAGFFDALDLENISLVLFVVEGDDLEGGLQINYLSSPRFILPDAGLSGADLPGLPGGMEDWLPDATSVGPGGSTIDLASSVERGVRFTYAIGSEGWAGGGITYDSFGSAEVETGDLSGEEALYFGLTGDGSTDRVKFEIQDADGQKIAIELRGLEAGAEKIWRIPASLLTGIDLTRIRLMYFIVEKANTGGELLIYHRPPPFRLFPSNTLTPEDIVDFTQYEEGTHYPAPISPTGASSSVDPLARGIRVNFQTGTGTDAWAGGGLSFDNFGTPAVETGDLSAAPKFVFGMKGSVSAVKLEVIDGSGGQVSIPLAGILSGAEQVWELPLSLLQGVDLTQVRLIYFIVEGENQSGSLEIYNIPA